MNTKPTPETRSNTPGIAETEATARSGHPDLSDVIDASTTSLENSTDKGGGQSNGVAFTQQNFDALRAELEELKTLLAGNGKTTGTERNALGKREYELQYAGKTRAVDVIVDTPAAPLQTTRLLGSPNELSGAAPDGWVNKLIFGDNLPVLRELLNLKQRGELKNADGSDGVRLVYIDPPFATKSDFGGKKGQKSYTDKIVGADFIELIRQRLILLREIMADNGSIYVHLDQKKGHYIKVVMDEVFGENNFQNEVVWWYRKWSKSTKHFLRNHDNLLFYTKGEEHTFNVLRVPLSVSTLKRFGGKRQSFADDDRTRKVTTDEASEGSFRPDVWDHNSIPANSNEKLGYPTQKPEALLETVLLASSNPGDLVLDCFMGSGTTIAVAEKLGRRWIGVDVGKHSLYTVQKRLLKIADSKALSSKLKGIVSSPTNASVTKVNGRNDGKHGVESSAFEVMNAGLYDLNALLDLDFVKYREFVLKLFGARDEPHELGGVALDGYLRTEHVLVYDHVAAAGAQWGYDFVNDLHDALGDRLRGSFYIVTPASSVEFVEDYVALVNTRGETVLYKPLRVPLSLLRSNEYASVDQPVSEGDVNYVVDKSEAGFGFIHVPSVECEYFVDSPVSEDLLNAGEKECVIQVNKFKSNSLTLSQDEQENLDTLAMIMVDEDYDGDSVFRLDSVHYKEGGDSMKRVEVNGESVFQARFPLPDGDVKDKQIMIVYVDTHGNEKIEIKKLIDFENKPVAKTTTRGAKK